MQRDEIVNLSVLPRVLVDPFQFIIDSARGKRVLNAGASGGVEYYLPERRESWLHHRLANVATELVGVDIDDESVKFAALHGVELLVDNCETCRFQRAFELIVMSDVIEHVNAPLRAIDNLAQQLAPEGRLLITTPNPTHYGLVIRAWLGLSTTVYYDHVTSFLPEHFQAICTRLGLHLTDVAFFSHVDKRTAGKSIKSRLARLIGRFAPRSHGTFLVVIQRRQA